MTFKNKKASFVLATVLTLMSNNAESAQVPDKKFYIGGGYQLAKIDYQDQEPRGNVTTTNTVFVTDDSQTTEVINADGSKTITIVQNPTQVETNLPETSRNLLVPFSLN